MLSCGSTSPCFVSASLADFYFSMVLMLLESKLGDFVVASGLCVPFRNSSGGRVFVLMPYYSI